MTPVIEVIDLVKHFPVHGGFLGPLLRAIAGAGGLSDGSHPSPWAHTRAAATSAAGLPLGSSSPAALPTRPRSPCGWPPHSTIALPSLDAQPRITSLPLSPWNARRSPRL